MYIPRRIRTYIFIPACRRGSRDGCRLSGIPSVSRRRKKPREMLRKAPVLNDASTWISHHRWRAIFNAYPSRSLVAAARLITAFSRARQMRRPFVSVTGSPLLTAAINRELVAIDELAYRCDRWKLIKRFSAYGDLIASA